MEVKKILAFSAVLVLTGCEVELQLDSANESLELSAGDKRPLEISGNWTRSDERMPVFVRLSSSDGLIQESIVDVTNTPDFTVTAVTNSALTAGSYIGQVLVDACADLDCVDVYPDSQVAVQLSLTVADVPGWTTHQGNPQHTGYFPVWINPENIELAWQWSADDVGDPIGGVNMPVANNGLLYISSDVFLSDAYLYAINPLDGTEVWRFAFGEKPALNPPAVDGNNVYISTSGHDDTFLWAISADEGNYVWSSPFSSQWGNYLAPVAIDGEVYQTGGYSGGYTYKYSAENGQALWSANATTSSGHDSVGVMGDKVFGYKNNALAIIARDTGTLEQTINDPLGDTDRDYHGAPVIVSEEQIILFSGGAFSGRASSNVEQYDNRVISSFDIANGSYTWSTDFTYKTHFAFADGVLYAGRGASAILDAIDLSTGDILWSWTAPAGDSGFHRNIVVTDNLVFASTDRAVYAINLENHEAEWTYPEAGMMLITDTRELVLVPGMRESDGRVLGFSTAP
ncbi:MAG: PQQ-binding-like beta-propeller repeat protein [Thalassolituus sp.]